MSIINKIGTFAKDGFTKISSGTYASGKVLKSFAKIQNDAFQNSVKNLNKKANLRTKISTVLKSVFDAIKDFKVKDVAEAAKKDFIETGIPKAKKISKGIFTGIVGLFGCIAANLGIKKTQQGNKNPNDYVSCSCCEVDCEQTEKKYTSTTA